ncbi:MAG: hypothetical protein WA005_02625 [Candidatus Binataceae bacterium]
MSTSRLDGSKGVGLRTRKAAKRRFAVWEDFCKNEAFTKTYRISPAEMSALKGVALMGKVRNPRDFIFMLNIIRTSKRLKASAEAE